MNTPRNMRILVTGANGLLGQKVVYRLLHEPGVGLIATARGACRLVQQQGYTYIPLDVEDAHEVMRVVRDVRPESIIHTAAMTNVDACETDCEACDRANIIAVRNVIRAAEAVGAHVVHLSTDFIFDGAAGPYDESAVPAPLSHYGRSKLLGEHEVISGRATWAILRTILVYGVVDNASRGNIVLWAKQALEKGEPINVVDDQWRSPTLAEDLADACAQAAMRRAQGVYHVSGRDMLCVIDIVREVADFYGLDKGLIRPVSSSTLNQPARRPPRTGFIITKAEHDLGYRPHSFRDGIAMADAQLRRWRAGKSLGLE